MIIFPETSFGRLSLVISLLSGLVAGPIYFLNSGAGSEPAVPSFWLKGDSQPAGLRIELVDGDFPEKIYPSLPAKCLTDTLPIFSTEPLDPDCIPPARDPCPEDLEPRFLDGRFLKMEFACLRSSPGQMTDEPLPWSVEWAIIKRRVSMSFGSFGAAMLPSVIVGALFAVLAGGGLFFLRGIWKWIKAGKR